MPLKPTDYLEKKTSQTLVCDVWPNDKFVLMSINGIPYIVAAGKMPWPINADHHIIGNNDILISLLNLHDKLSPAKDLSPSNIADYESNCPPTDIKRICQWCEKYGSPFPPVKTGDWLGIRLGDFRIKLNRLYRAYEIWLKTVYEAEEAEKEMEQLQAEYELLNRFPIYPHVDFSLSTPRLFFRCRNMFDMAHTQLSFMAASQLEGSIALCDRCQSRFIKKHGSQILCKHCSDNRSQYCREKKRRERQENAKKSQQ